MSNHFATVVQDMIKSDILVIFSKTYCPYCDEVKEICSKLKKPFTSYELDKRNDGEDIQNVLGEITGAKTVPRIFIKGKFLGGASDFQNLYSSGSLTNMLEEKKSGILKKLKNRLQNLLLK